MPVRFKLVEHKDRWEVYCTIADRVWQTFPRSNYYDKSRMRRLVKKWNKV